MTGNSRLAGFFQALGDPMRVRIAQLARTSELSVGEVASVLGQSQPSISRHVRILEEAGIVKRRREGTWVFIEAGREGWEAGLADLFDAIGDERDSATFAADGSRLDAVLRERAEAVGHWFAQRADQWDCLRSLQVSERQVEEAIEAQVGAGPLGALVDIGTGTGRMLELFAPRADAAVGIDRSPEMLRLARVKLDAAGIDNASLRQGDMFALPLGPKSADTVILHLVLHFAATPGQVIAEASRILRPGGQLLVADFAPHDHEELRQTLKHQRLGFSDDSMARWFASAGLEGEESVKLEGGELTVSLWRAVRPSSTDSQRHAA